jgi:nitric oxide reductase activation protein
MAVKEAWALFLDEFKAQRAIDKKRREYVRLTSKNLDYPLLESITKAVAQQAPGFYTRITIEGAVIEFGIKENAKSAARQPDERF